MLTPAEHARADRFQMWLDADKDAHQPVEQLELFAEVTPIGGGTTAADTRIPNAQREHERAA